MRSFRSFVPQLALLVSVGACGGKPKPAPPPPSSASTTAAADTTTAVADDTTTPVADDTTTPVADDTATPVAEDTAAPVADDTAAPIAAAPVAPVLDAFAALRQVPQTLQYLVDGQAVACAVTDAGVDGTDVDIKVSCSPEVAWTCLSKSYFVDQSSRSATAMWRKDGCYAARADGLWYFATCPTDKAPFEDPAAAKATRMLSANMLTNAAKAVDDDVTTTTLERLALTDRGAAATLDMTCSAASMAGMMKSIVGTSCQSPRYGYVASSGLSTEMDIESCRDRSRLVAVEAGVVPPTACIAEHAFVGTWSFTTKVEHAKDAKLVGSEGHYTLSITPSGEGCGLAIALDKVGIGGKAMAADKVQHAALTLAKPNTTCPYPSLGELCLQLPVTLADAAGTGVTARYVLGTELSSAVDHKARGLWLYEGKAAATQVRGVLQAQGGSADPLQRFDDAATPRAERCIAKLGEPVVKGGALVDLEPADYDAFQACNEAE